MDRPAPAFRSNAGPFRIALRGLHLHRDRQLIRGPWVRIDRNGQRINVPSEDFLPDRLEFDDAEGHPLSWVLLGAPSASTTHDEIQVRTFVSGVAPPARLRVYRLHRLATEIPFEFGEVPSP